MSAPRPRIGLALGSGSARGWAHVGVIRALAEMGVHPDVVCGTSIGALVGAAYAAGQLDPLEAWVRSLRMKDVIAFMDVSLSGGMLKGEKLMDFFRRHWQDRPIEQLELPFGAVATALHTGEEVWLRQGSTIEAVRASIAMPAVFTPVVRDGQTLVDGGLVNPVPVSLARAMGADVVIAVDLSADILGRHLRRQGAPPPPIPSLLDIMATSLNIMQVQVSRGRLAVEPPDVIVTPRLAQLGLMEFHRMQEAFDEGKQAVERVRTDLEQLLHAPAGAR